MITTVLATESLLLRQLLVKDLKNNPSIQILEDHHDAREAAESAVKLKSNMLIVAARMSGPCPFEAVRWAKTMQPSMHAIFLTNSIEPEHVARAIEVGATGYIQKKTISVEDLKQTIMRVHRGEKQLPKCREAKGTAIKALSPRQAEVLKLLAEGNNVKEISMVLDLSSKTVEVHKNNLMHRLGLHSRTQLVIYAVKHKIITCSELAVA